MLGLNEKYVRETYDEKGLLTGLDIHWDENYNFAYDVIDELAAKCPDKRAMLWTNDVGGFEKVFG